MRRPRRYEDAARIYFIALLMLAVLVTCVGCTSQSTPKSRYVWECGKQCHRELLQEEFETGVDVLRDEWRVCREACERHYERIKHVL